MPLMDDIAKHTLDAEASCTPVTAEESASQDLGTREFGRTKKKLPSKQQFWKSPGVALDWLMAPGTTGKPHSPTRPLLGRPYDGQTSGRSLETAVAELGTGTGISLPLVATAACSSITCLTQQEAIRSGSNRWHRNAQPATSASNRLLLAPPYNGRPNRRQSEAAEARERNTCFAAATLHLACSLGVAGMRIWHLI